jgi:hypothetical protein
VEVEAVEVVEEVAVAVEAEAVEEAAVDPPGEPTNNQ